MSEFVFKTIRENVVSAIRMKILNQELVPGTRIIEQNLSEEFGISRGPIREALRQLEQEGLVEYVRNAGCSVKTITIEDVYEIYLLRCNYEMTAIKVCGGVFSEEDFAEMDQVLEDMKQLNDNDLPSLIECDHRLHKIIISKSNLSRLIKAWTELNYGSMIASINSGSYRATLADRQYIIHRNLVEVLRSGDTNAICKAIYQHYMLPLKKVISENGLSPDDFFFSSELEN